MRSGIGLSREEGRLLRAVAQGYSLPEIARLLGCSEEEAGSRFRACLQRLAIRVQRRAANDRTRPRGVVGNVPQSPIRLRRLVLIVEDDDANLTLVRDLLRGHGYGTLEARDAAPVIEMARQYRPDLILMDIRLPGVSGLDATRALKQDPGLQDIPVLAITAFLPQIEERNAREAGCDGFLVKPISVSAFLQTVRRLMD